MSLCSGCFDAIISQGQDVHTGDINFLLMSLCLCRPVVASANMALEQFSTECRKTKTRVITLANHKGHR